MVRGRGAPLVRPLVGRVGRQDAGVGDAAAGVHGVRRNVAVAIGERVGEVDGRTQ